MENRIKACQLDLFADRTSATAMRANQFRLWFYGGCSVGVRDRSHDPSRIYSRQVH